MTISPPTPNQNKPEQWLWVIACCVLLCVFLPIGLVSRDFWDGVIGSYGLETQQFDGIRAWLVPSNWGLVYLMLRGIAWLSNSSGIPAWLLVKLILLLSVCGIANETRLLCEKLLGWSRLDSRLAGVLALGFPCWSMLYGSTFLTIVFMWWVFAGHRLAHSGRSLALRCMGLVLLLLSFQVNSNFVMVFALEAARWLRLGQSDQYRWRWGASACASAVAIYLSLRWVWPPSGIYQGYNNLVLPFSANGLKTWARAIAMYLTWLPLLALPAGVTWLFGKACAQRGGMARVPAPSVPWREWACIGILLLGAVFPYVAVGKGAPLFVLNFPSLGLGVAEHQGKVVQAWFYTTVDGWSWRNVFLMAAPASIASVALLRAAVGQASTLAQQRRLWWLACASAVVFNGAWLLHGHAAKHLRAAQEESIVRGLRAIAPPPAGDVNLAITQELPWYAWMYESNYWFWLAYGQADWASAQYGPEPGSRARALQERSDARRLNPPPSVALLRRWPVQSVETTLELALPEGLNAKSWLLDRLGFQPIEAARIEHLTP